MNNLPRNPNSLGYLMSVAPTVKPMSIAHIPLRDVARAASMARGMKYPLYGESLLTGELSKPAHPEVDAVKFYLMNHAIATLASRKGPEESLSKAQADLVAAYHRDILVIGGLRAFYYLLYICTRESRHNKSGSTGLDDVGTFALNHYKHNVKGHNAGSIIDGLAEAKPGLLMGDWVDLLLMAFGKGSYSSGFGGQAWYRVTEPLAQFVHGQISMETLLDTVWTLAHNNGPIFNKGVLYTPYTGELALILDVQRSGQIPSLVAQTGGNKLKVSPQDYNQYCQMITDAGLGDLFQEKLDWHKVKALGAIGNYSAQIAGQDFISPYDPNYAGSPPSKVEVSIKATQKAASDALGDLKVFTHKVYPGLKVSGTKR